MWLFTRGLDEVALVVSDGADAVTPTCRGRGSSRRGSPALPSALVPLAGGPHPAPTSSGPRDVATSAAGSGSSGKRTTNPNCGAGRPASVAAGSSGLRSWWRNFRRNHTASWPAYAGRRAGVTACTPPTWPRASSVICAATSAASSAVSIRRIASASLVASSWLASRPMLEEFTVTRSTLKPGFNRNARQCRMALWV